MINIDNATFKYPSGKGTFDININVKEGEVLGYLGPNGAGKTTTIRQLMGFVKSSSGSCKINNLDCFDKASKVKEILGYIPGEIAFIEGMSGGEYLDYILSVRKIKDKTKMNYLLDMFEFDPKGNIRKYSKGMKQKLAIVSAFMHNPKVLVLDEPTSGLDPLMQSRFVDLILEEKKMGKTILMSSHMFEEIEKTCDNVALIKEGRIVANSDVITLKNNQVNAFLLNTSDNTGCFDALKKANLEAKIENEELCAYVKGENTDTFIKTISNFNILNLKAKNQSIEEIFMNFYSREEK